MKTFLALAATSLVATAALAQDKPLNLKLPPDYVPAPASTAAAPVGGTTQAAPAVTKSGESVAITPSRPKAPPGTYYGDTSGRMENVEVADDTPRCDDATYNKPQVHGSLTTGVVSASHGGSGSYQGGAVSLSQAFGSCDHPTGGVSISVGGTQGHFGRGRW
ncbi:hypothetical protein [Luteibacter sp. Lutesp34]|uniref:hypothetical protein n=1 Tax=Luteibacter sp. Lutesp34 TaxID=3243030 RepID=UPI0039B48A3B